MKRQELDKAIEQGKAPSAIMLYGESHFLIDRYVRLLSDIPDANLLGLYYHEYNFAAAKAHLSQGSLFGGRNVLIVKSEKRVPKSDQQALIALCKKTPDNLFIYAFFGAETKKGDYAAFDAKSGGTHVRFFIPFFNEAKTIVMQEAKALGIAIDAHSATHLLLTQNSDLSLACSELEKLRILGRPITTKEIDDLVYGMGGVKLEQFIIDLLKKKDIRNDLERVLESGEDEIRIITAISTFIAQLNLFYIYGKLHGPPDSAAILGYKLPPFIEKERSALALSFNQPLYSAMITLLLEMELKLKSGAHVDKNALLLSTLLKLQSMLSLHST